LKLTDTLLDTVLFGMGQAIRVTAARTQALSRKRIRGKNFMAQIKTLDGSTGRYFIFGPRKFSSRKGIRTDADVHMIFSSADLAARLLTPPRDQLDLINAAKDGHAMVEGPDELAIWFSETLNMLLTIGAEYGTDLGGGVMRYASNTNGGPVFVHVKGDKIIRITPIEFDDTDARPWTIHARGKRFTPPRRTTLSPHALGWKSMVYSKDRILYPMKRVDFDADGERNPHNRGVSGYERISWNEALDLVAGEIKRVKRDCGPGAILNGSGSHHTWGHLGYWLSARLRFFNSLGFTPVVHNPDSWEGWYWGAMHHWGHSGRLGAGEAYGTIEDCLQEAEMVVFWSSDPEATGGVYGAFEGTIRRQWLKELDIELVHIDPFYNHTAALLGGKWLAPRPATGNALALAIAHVWMTEDLYDKPYVAERTVGFDEWRAYVLGDDDGVPKTPEWQESEAGIAAKDCVRWPGGGGPARPIWRQAGSTASAAPAGVRRATSGPAPWSA
jgi:hypothetical protein